MNSRLNIVEFVVLFFGLGGSFWGSSSSRAPLLLRTVPIILLSVFSHPWNVSSASEGWAACCSDEVCLQEYLANSCYHVRVLAQNTHLLPLPAQVNGSSSKSHLGRASRRFIIVFVNTQWVRFRLWGLSTRKGLSPATVLNESNPLSQGVREEHGRSSWLLVHIGNLAVDVKRNHVFIICRGSSHF